MRSIKYFLCFLSKIEYGLSIYEPLCMYVRSNKFKIFIDGKLIYGERIYWTMSVNFYVLFEIWKNNPEYDTIM